MARVGNETRLILRLASERMHDELRRKEIAKVGNDFYHGFRDGLVKYQQTLDNIVAELETK